MKKFFYYLAITLLFFQTPSSNAGVNSIAEPVKHGSFSAETYKNQLQKLYSEIPNLNNKKEVQKYLKKRLKFLTSADSSVKENINDPSSTSIVDTAALNQKQQNTLTAYEKIYQQSLERASSTDTLNEDASLDGGTFYREKQAQAPTKFVPDFPYVTIKLSDEKEILAPAEEHIAYLLTTIKIEPLGLISVSEKFVFVSNNEGFPQGFFRILPKYTYSRLGKRRRLDFTLDSVTINGTAHDYKVTEIGNYLHIEPKTPLNLPTGIYTYEFNYYIDRSIWFYDNYDEFYWDITARTIKNVIGSANAVVYLPKEKTFLAQNATASTHNGLNAERVSINELSSNSLGFADTEALAVGEDIHLLITLDKNTLIPPTPTQKYLWFIQDHGAEFFALLVLLALYLSYKISLTQIYKNQDKIRASIKKTPSNWRMLNQNTFDYRSLGAEILNLCSKNILELSSSKSKVSLIKKTDSTQKLSKTEKSLISILFPNQETILNSGKESLLKLKRAYSFLHKKTLQEVLIYKIKLTALYLISGLIMILLGALGASYLSTNPKHTFFIISTTALLILPYMFIYQISFKNKHIKRLAKVLCLLISLFIASFTAIYTSRFYALLMLLSLYLISYYLKLFSRRNGLMRNKVKETEDYKTYLKKNPDLAIKATDFNIKAPYIYAFELENNYPTVESFTQISTLTNTKG